MIRDDQRVPFQRSASSLSALAAGSHTVPTTTHARLEMHDTPPKEGWVVAGGAGGLSVIHLKPFHRKTDESPATMHALPDAQETLLTIAPELAGSRWTDLPDVKGDPALTATIASDTQPTARTMTPRNRSSPTWWCSGARTQLTRQP